MRSLLTGVMTKNDEGHETRDRAAAPSPRSKIINIYTK
jgi:hypothetical protein